MIVGQINPNIEAVIPVTIQDPRGQNHTLDAVIDTGFSGYLTLTSAIIATLGLDYSESRVFSIGKNATANFDLYEAAVTWDGEWREIRVLSSEADPLVGMSLLKGFRVTMDVIDGGEVRLETRA